MITKKWSLDYDLTENHLPWVPEVFLACSGNFLCWPKADTSSAVGHYKNLTETGNRTRKVSDTQSKNHRKRKWNVFYLPILRVLEMSYTENNYKGFLFSEYIHIYKK